MRDGRRACGANAAADGRALLTGETSELERFGGGDDADAVLWEVLAPQADFRRRSATAAAEPTRSATPRAAAATSRAAARAGGDGDRGETKKPLFSIAFQRLSTTRCFLFSENLAVAL